MVMSFRGQEVKVDDLRVVAHLGVKMTDADL